MIEKLTSFAVQAKPTLIGGSGLTLANIVPDPTHVGQWTQIAIAVVTVITQIISLFKKDKNVQK